jgi:hypothetical protein
MVSPAREKLCRNRRHETDTPESCDACFASDLAFTAGALIGDWGTDEREWGDKGRRGDAEVMRAVVELMAEHDWTADEVHAECAAVWKALKAEAARVDLDFEAEQPELFIQEHEHTLPAAPGVAAVRPQPASEDEIFGDLGRVA